MRIILWLAAAGAMAVGTAAAAKPGGPGSGHGGGLQVGWSSGGGHHAGKGVRTRFGVGRIEIDRRHRRHHRRSGRDDFNPYAGIGIAGGVAEVETHGAGFFDGAGGRIRLRGGRPYYDYDRSYPYRWASARDGLESERDDEARTAEAPDRCTFENGVRVCRGW